MNLPQAVRRQLEAADELQRNVYSQAPEGQSDSELPVEQDTQEGQDETTAKPEQAPEPGTQTQSQQPPAKSEGEDPEIYKRRYFSLQGMYNTHVPQLQQAVRQLQEENQGLKQEVERLKQGTGVQPQAKQAASVSDKDREAFGDDLIDLQRRVADEAISKARGEFEQTLTGYQQVIDSLKNQLAAQGQQTEAVVEHNFLGTLSQHVPDWKQLDTDPGFLQWLQQVDRRIGVSLQVLLNDAVKSKDVERVAEIFNDYKRTNQKTEQPVVSPQEKQNRQQELQRQVAPSKARSTATPTQEKVWTGNEYAQVFDPRFAKGKSQADLAQLQADADKALQEGRIRW